MPSFAESLEATLHNALKNAAERAHEYATLEHLLLALIDDEEAAKVMQACGVDLGELSDAVIQYLDNELESLKVGGNVDPSPTSGFQRVVQRAILHVQSSGKDVVTGANVLVALFSERESHAVYLPAAAGHERAWMPFQLSSATASPRIRPTGPKQKPPKGSADRSEPEEEAAPRRRRATRRASESALEAVHGEPQREGQASAGVDPLIGRQCRGGPHHPDPVPPVQEQSALCG